MTTKSTPINPTERRVALLQSLALAKAKADAAKAEFEQVKAAFLKACPDQGVLEAEGYKAIITIAERREFDAEAAEEWLEDDDFEAVTVRKVDSRAWDAVSTKFDAKIISAVVIAKPTTTLTIKEV